MQRNPLDQQHRLIIDRVTRIVLPTGELIPAQSSAIQTLKTGGVEEDGTIWTCGILGRTPLGAQFRLCNRGY